MRSVWKRNEGVAPNLSDEQEYISAPVRHRAHAALALQLRRPVQKRFFRKTLRRLGITPAHLLYHDIKSWCKSIPSLMTALLPLNWLQVSSGEDNFTLTVLFILAGVGS